MRLGGWWRLWIVLALTYGLIVAVFTLSTFPTVESIPYDQSHLKLLSDRTLLILAGRVQPPLPDGPAWNRDPIILEMPNHHTFEVFGSTTSEQSQEIAKDYIRVLNSIARERRIGSLKTALLAWVLPCLLILVLGWAVGWIYRGFKRNSNEV
jgi:hypothetical protein